MQQLDFVKLFSELVFPVAVAGYLLWERTTLMEKLRRDLMEMQIALRLILNELNIQQKFDTELDSRKKIKENE